MAALRLKSYEFRREREHGWRQLDRIVTKAERSGLRALDGEELALLPLLYRGTLSSLSVARSISLDRNLLEYLESLSERAYFCVYGTKRHLLETLRSFFSHRFPVTVRALRRHLLLATVFFLLGGLIGFALTMQDPSRFYAFVSPEYAQGRGPTSATEDLREVLYSGGEDSSSLGFFATYLFTHNAEVGIRVMDAHGGDLSTDAVVVRNLMRAVELHLPLAVLVSPEILFPGGPGPARLFASLWLFAFLFMPLFNRRRLRIGDMVAGTMVVLAPQAVLLKDVGGRTAARAARGGAAFPFTREQLSVYGIYELQVLEDLLRKRGAEHTRAAMHAVAARIRRKIQWTEPLPRRDTERFLREFYAAMRGHLEQRMLFGKKKRDKDSKED